MSKVEIGQILYDAPRRPGYGYTEYKVEKIGRKWVALSGGARCTVDSLHLDCRGYSNRQLYKDKGEHEQQAKLNAAWIDLRRDFYNARMPADMTVETINSIRRTIGLQVFGETPNTGGK